MRAALLEDQRSYLWVRDEVVRQMPAADRAEYLRLNMAGRADFLDAVSTAPRTDLTGFWANFAGAVHVSARTGGMVHIEASAAEPVTGRWTCEFDVNARVVGAGAHGEPADSPELEFYGEWAINLERKGQILHVEECCQSGYCGNGGTISGLYLPLEGGRPGRRDD